MVALLRAVNVGGRTVRSTDLASLVSAAGFTGAKTLLQSGNVVFDARRTASPSGRALQPEGRAAQPEGKALVTA